MLGARRRSFLTAVILSVSVSLGSSVVLSAGVALSSPPFLISSNAAGGGRPAIASDGTNFFTVWSDPNTDSIFGARVGTDGTVLDPAGIAIYSTGGSSGGPPSVAFDGANFLVVWVETGFSILAVRVTPSGVVLDAPPIQIPPFAKVRPISLAFDGANYLVVWRNHIDQIVGARLSPAGVNLGGISVSSGPSGFYPWVSFNGVHFLVAWHGWQGDTGDWNVSAARVATDGTVLDPGGFLVASPPQHQDHCSVASDGTDWLVVCHDWRPDNNEFDSSISGVRVAADGTVLDPNMFSVASNALGQGPPTVVYDGQDYLAVWNEGDKGAKSRASDAYARHITTTGQVLDPQAIPVATAFSHQFGATVAYDGAGTFLSVWNGFYPCDEQPPTCLFGQILVKTQDSAIGDPQSSRPIVAQSGALDAAQVPEAASTPPTLVWRAVPQVWSGNIHRIQGIDSSHGYAATGCGTCFDIPLLRYDGNQWSVWTMIPLRGRQFGLFPAGVDDVWTNGLCWDAFHYDGTTLTPYNCQGSPGSAMGIWGVRPDPLFAVGTRGEISRFEGGNWNIANGPSSFDLWDVWGTADDDVWAVGDRGTVVHWDGQTWAPVDGVSTLQSLNAIWGSGPSDIFVVGDFGTILHYNGASWQSHTSGTLEHLFGVWGFSSREVYAVGSGGTILRYDGAAWNSEETGTASDLWTVGTVGRDVWAGGQDGTLLRRCLFCDGFETGDLSRWSAYGR